MRFFVGLHHPGDTRHGFKSSFISVNALRGRKSPLQVGEWIMDSGDFTEISKHGRYRDSVATYAAEVRKWGSNGSGTLLAAASQDYMCEAEILAVTGLTVADHQRLTIERYDALLAENTGVYIMPVLQGYAPHEYAAHVRAYGSRLAQGAWVGVGSVCRRNGDPSAIAEVLATILQVRPDLKLHGFGLKLTALRSYCVQIMLHTADSMAWSYAARKQGRNANDWREAQAFDNKINALLVA